MRILWLTTNLLLPLDKGGKLRTWHLMRHLAARHEITCICFADPDQPSLLAPKDTQCTTLSPLEEDCVHALDWLADALAAAQQPIEPAKYGPMPLATGKIDSLTLAL